MEFQERAQHEQSLGVGVAEWRAAQGQQGVSGVCTGNSGAIWKTRPSGSGVGSQSHGISDCQMAWSELWVTLGAHVGEGTDGRGRPRDPEETERRCGGRGSRNRRQTQEVPFPWDTLFCAPILASDSVWALGCE